MNVSLTPELEKYVGHKVASGLYSTASEVVRDGLRLLQERDRLFEDRLEQLRTEVNRGIQDLAAGRAAPFDKASLDRIKSKGRAQLQAKRRKKGA
jgi:antitoxin ParD1/3/4